MPRTTEPPTRSRSRPTIRGQFVLLLAAASGQAGVQPQRLYRQIGLSAEALAQEDVFVDLEAYLGLWETVMRAVRDPGFPLAYARGIQFESYGVVGLAALTSRDGVEAAQRMARYQRLSSDSGQFTVDDRGPMVRLGWDRPGTPSLGLRVANEAVLAEAMVLVRRCAGTDVAATAVRLRHPAPRDLSAHRRFFGVTPRFGDQENALDVPRAVLSRPMPLAHVALSRHLIEEAERRLSSSEEPNIVEHVERAALAELPSGAPSMTAIARSLQMSERQLRRELDSAGVGFRSMVEDLRRRRAAALLGEEAASVVDTAFVLGFSEVSAFSRAFKRWFGVPPAEYRERSRRPVGGAGS